MAVEARRGATDGRQGTLDDGDGRPDAGRKETGVVTRRSWS